MILEREEDISGERVFKIFIEMRFGPMNFTVLRSEIISDISRGATVIVRFTAPPEKRTLSSRNL